MNNRIRRCKRKFLGTDISIPCNPTNQAVKKELNELVNKCKYTQGELIVPQSFGKIILNDDLSLNVIEFTTLGRKHQLSLIREKNKKKQEGYFRIFSDNQLNNMTNFDLIEELKRIDEYDKFTGSNNELKSKLKLHQRRCFLQFWQDGSAIANHGHIFIMVNAVYDKALYITDYLKLGYHKNVQAEVEKPELYLIARFPSNDQRML